MPDNLFYLPFRKLLAWCGIPLFRQLCSLLLSFNCNINCDNPRYLLNIQETEMRDLNSKELKSIGGAGDPLTDQNSQLIRQIMIGA